MFSFGKNSKHLPEIKSYLQLLADQLNEQLLRIMLVAATFTLIVNLFQTIPLQWLEGASIYFAVLFIAAFTAANEYVQEKQYLKLHDTIRNEEVNVIRG